jgi:hypothetical protein
MGSIITAVFVHGLSEDIQLIGVSSYSMQAEDSDLKLLTIGASTHSGANVNREPTRLETLHAFIAGAEICD